MLILDIFVCSLMIVDYNKPFTVLFGLVAAILLLPSLTSHGMFMDGIQYAVVSKNLAHGIGEFWFPFLSTSWAKQNLIYFMEHPPLFYYLESLFFKLFGDGFLTERIFCITFFILNVTIIHILWHKIKARLNLSINSWLPLLLWIITPTVYWAFTNNMIEIVGSFLVLVGVNSSYEIYFTEDRLSKIKHILVLSFSLCLGFLTKGIPMAFPVISVICFQIIYKHKSWKETLVLLVSIIAIPILFFTLLVSLNDKAAMSLGFYLKERLFFRVSNEPQVDNRFVVVFWLISDLLVPIGLIVLALIIQKALKLKGQFNQASRNIFYSFLLIGMTGVLPLALTKVQRAVYYLPAISIIAIALSVYASRIFSTLFDKWRLSARVYSGCYKLLSYGLIFLVFLNVYYYGRVFRDEKVLEEVHKIGKGIGSSKTMEVDYDTYLKWDFQFYLLRYYDIRMNPWGMESKDFVLIPKKKGLQSKYYLEFQSLNLNEYYLYRKIRN